MCCTVMHDGMGANPQQDWLMIKEVTQTLVGCGLGVWVLVIVLLGSPEGFN